MLWLSSQETFEGHCFEVFLWLFLYEFYGFKSHLWYAIGVPFCFLMKMFNFPRALVEEITSTIGNSLDTLVKVYLIRGYGFIWAFYSVSFFKCMVLFFMSLNLSVCWSIPGGTQGLILVIFICLYASATLFLLLWFLFWNWDIWYFYFLSFCSKLFWYFGVFAFPYKLLEFLRFWWGLHCICRSLCIILTFWQHYVFQSMNMWIAKYVIPKYSALK